MLKLADKLTAEKVDSILVRLLPDEKSAKRRLNKFESFIYTKAQESRVWLENYLLANDTEASEDELDKAEKQACTITLPLLFEFEAYLKTEAYWHEKNCMKTPETQEARIMDYQPCRWLARFPQNKGRKTSKNVSGVVYDTVQSWLTKLEKPITARNMFYETSMVLLWHPEVEDNDRISECREGEGLGEWELVVVKPNHQIIGHPTRTIEDVAQKSIISRTKTMGISGRKLKIDDAFLGLLIA